MKIDAPDQKVGGFKLRQVSLSSYRSSNAALSFASKAHGSQRYGDKPYSYHLEQVVATARQLGFSTDRHLTTAALHDILEDTSVRAVDLTARYGPEVSIAVTQLSRADGQAIGPYLDSMNALAFSVKLADRLSNVRHLAQGGGADLVHHRSLAMRYLRELPDFVRTATRFGNRYVDIVATIRTELGAAQVRIAASS